MFKRVQRAEEFSNQIGELFGYLEKGKTRNVTFVVTEQCSLRCKYCYECNKSNKRMTFDVAKKFIDMLFDTDDGSVLANIIEFIGGEPFLEVDLITKICEYWDYKCIMTGHRWGARTIFNFSTNGMHNHEPKVQEFIKKYHKRISINITIDGDKELHDSCRVTPDGKGSYDIAHSNAEKYKEMYGADSMGSKITIAPENLKYLFKAIKHYIINDNAYDINANTVFEKGWTLDHAKQFYQELKKIADFMIDNNYEDRYLSLFQENGFSPMTDKDNQNWCFTKDTMVLTDQGNKEIDKVEIGDIVYTKDNEKHKVKDVLIRDNIETIILKVTGAFDIQTTPDHPFYVKKFKYIGFKYNLHYEEPQWISAKDIKPKDKVALFKHKLGNVDYDKNVAYLVGRYIGDGWTSRDRSYICCGFKEKDYLNEKFKLANIKYSITDYRIVNQFNVWTENTEFLRLIRLCGSNALQKKIAPEIFDWNKESLLALLKGYLDADGSETNETFKVNTSSIYLANDLLILLRALDYLPTCYFNKRQGKQKIENRIVNVNNRYEIYFYKDKGANSRYCKKDEENNIVWTRARQVNKKTHLETVYNLKVTDNNTFIANGIIVHNCGGTGEMLACGTDGKLFPCIRYMGMSLGNSREELTCGNLDDGIDKDMLENMYNSVTRRSQSTDECYYCPIAKLCAWCSGYNYQVFGTVNKRATFICVMHKARSLGNVYYWNRVYKKHNIKDRFKRWLSDDECLKIINQEELDLLNSLENQFENNSRVINDIEDQCNL